MTELIINIPDKKKAQVEKFITGIGGKVKIKSEKISSKKKPQPTFLFGQWKTLDKDAVKIRKELWARKSW
ncbi:MAG: hypothetical protein K2X48_08470 [Chitinophagaceae bacterium]|nr:hypothetical protein [Chitinophagaceae bacterium]